MENEHQFSLFAAELCSLGGTLTLVHSVNGIEVFMGLPTES